MRKMFLFLMLTFFSMSMNAQEVYKAIRSKAMEERSNPLSSPILRKFNQFKVDALDYMAIKMREQMPDSTAQMLDDQAYAMSLFLNLYTKAILDHRSEPAAFQVKIIQLFMDASYYNPLFRDTDKDLVLSYFSDGESMTRFSLDTNWPQALLVAESALKKLK